MKHLLFLLCLGSAAAWQRTKCGPGDQVTAWGRNIDPNNILPEYPRPQLVRSGPWKNLNGIWEFQPAQQGQSPPFGHALNGTILVPFPVESCLSGVGKNYKFLLYRHVLDSPFPFPLTGRAILHFGAVDWQTDVYVNGEKVGNHTGGYDGFEFDVTAQLKATSNEIFVYVYDPSDEGFQPNGKQRISAIQNPDGDTYTPSSGIWQTVWLELVPTQYVSDLKIVTPDLQSAKITVNTADGNSQPVTIDILDDLTVVASVSSTTGSETNIKIPNAKTWSPESPFLYNVNIRVQSGDHVTSYLGVRTVALAQVQYPGRPATGPQPGIDRPGNDMPGSPFKLPSPNPDLCWARCNATSGCEAWAYAVPGCDQFADPMCWLKSSSPGTTSNKCRVSGSQATPPGLVARPTLNGKFIFMAGWLDQSWWPDGLYTAPTDEALAFDVKVVKEFGLNTIRLHQKVNSERWYWYADTEGIIVLQDMIQKYGGATQATVAPFTVDLKAMIKGRYNHPSIIQWDVFNEGDCVAQFKPQEFVDLVRQLDPTRLVDTNSGGPANDLHIADVNDIHTYPWPGNPRPSKTQYAMLGEFGGVGAFVAGKEWVPGKCQTYLHVDTPQDEADTYVEMAKQILANKDDISVSIYTQITDVERECDGFLNFDRTNKFNSTQMQAIVTANQKLING